MIFEIRCDECGAFFIFGPHTQVNNQPERQFPLYCPYCGRVSCFDQEVGTTFTVGQRSDLSI